jgi:hypothetical protein
VTEHTDVLFLGKSIQQACFSTFAATRQATTFMWCPLCLLTTYNHSMFQDLHQLRKGNAHGSIHVPLLLVKQHNLSKLTAINLQEQR